MILFLDFDGVLHPNDAYLPFRSKKVYLGKESMEAGCSLFMHANKLVELLDKSNVDVEIVLSTSWVRVFRNFDKVKSFLPNELQRRVVGATWHSQMVNQYDWSQGYLTRCMQIMGYVTRHNIPMSKWVALDDDDFKWPKYLRNNLVHCNQWQGLGDTNTQAELLEKLKGRGDVDELTITVQALADHFDEHPNIWPQQAVSAEPEKYLAAWSIAKVTRAAEDSSCKAGAGTFHFVGDDLRHRNGAVSSAITRFNSITMCGVTESGRVYQLHGLPGYSGDADYVLRNWARGNKVEVEDATRAFIAQYGIDLDHIGRMK